MKDDLKLVTAPLKEPLTLAEVKLDRGLDPADATFNTKLEDLITSARQRAEHDTNRYLIEQTWDLLLHDGFPWLANCHYQYVPHEIRIPRVPLKVTGGIIHVKYLDTNGAQQTLVAGTDYYVGGRGEPAVVVPAHGKSWPSTRNYMGSGGEAPVEVRFTAGYGTNATDVPKRLIEAMLLIIGARFENREEIDPGTGGQLGPIPDGAARIFSEYHFTPW